MDLKGSKDELQFTIAMCPLKRPFSKINSYINEYTVILATYF